MKSALLIGIAALTVACGGSRQPRPDSSATAAGAASQSPAANASAATAPSTSDARVTLVGCLQGPGLSGGTGTTGSTAGDRARARATGNNAAVRQEHGAASSGPFVLANAAVESGGVGANGAGGSGGPLVSTGTSYTLDGLPADAQASVNKQVRITGRIDVRATSGTAATAGGPSATSSTTAGIGARDDVRANSATVAGDSTTHRLTVETVHVVAQRCGG